MSPVQVSCPACGGPIRFKIGSSIVTVCAYCRSVVARGDRKVEDLGKVAELVETGSPLQVGLQGRYQGVPFELTGRAQLGHPAGGMWDEWYAAFADGRWGWLAEAQGRFYLTFQQPLGPDAVPPYDQLPLGETAQVPGSPVPWTVAEKATAKALGAEGEIPYRLVPNQSYPYADLSGPKGEFATLDYGEAPPLFFAGQEVTLTELGVPEKAGPGPREVRAVAGIQVSCPQCGGPLALRAPDKTERVACPNCAALLDVQQGQLRFLKALEPGKVTPVIPLGSVGKFAEGQLTVIGFLQRSVVIDEVSYFWEEYLLYQPRIGFRWLVRSDDHWNYVVPVPPGAAWRGGTIAKVDDKVFKLFQRADACVTYVLGECYWKVEVGERVLAEDYVRPPEILSREESATNGAGEINWSLGTYLPPAAVEQAFGLKSSMPRPWKVAPNQPFLYKQVYWYGAALTAIAVVLGVLLLATRSNRQVYEGRFPLQPVQGAEQTQVFFSEPFELKGWQNIQVVAEATVDNSWVYVEGDFINEATGEVQGFEMPVEYYHGVESGESWSEGNRYAAMYLSAVPAGKYTLRLEVQRQKPQESNQLFVRVRQGVPRVLPFFLMLGALAVVPALVAGYHIYFESQRWQDSDYSPYRSSEPSKE